MLALDEPDNNDDVFEVEGFKFAVEKTLLEEVGTINIDGGSNGFLVTAANLKKSECSSAGGGCSC